MQRMAADQTARMLVDALPAFEGEADYELALAAFPPSLKTMEGFLRSTPDNAELLLLLARGFAAYALVGVEDRLERAEAAGDEEEAERQRQRARDLYLRAHRYGLRCLELRQPGFTRALGRPSDPASAGIVSRFTATDVPGLFWSGMALASAINVARDDITLVAKLGAARTLVERVVALDEGYYYGGAHLVLGALLGSSGTIGGGNVRASRRHFERALALSERRFLLVQEMYARTLAVQLQDRALFESLLREISDAALSIEPAQKLANLAAKRRARRLLARAGELF